MTVSRWRLLVVPILVVAVTQALRPALSSWLGPQTAPVQMFSFLAVFIAAWTGGVWAGLLTMVLSVTAAYISNYLVAGIVPTFGPIDVARLVLFSIISLVFSVLTEAHLRSQRRLQEQTAEARRTGSELKNFAFLVQNASDFIGMCDLDFRPWYVNKAGLDMVGLPSLEALANTPVFDFFFEEDLPRLQQDLFPAVMRDGQASIELRFRHFKTGEPIWMEYSVIRVDDAAGRPTGFATISRDLTTHRRAEDLLREIAKQKQVSLERFRELADSMPQIVWSAGPDGAVDYLNRRWYELSGDPTAGPDAAMHEDDRPRADAIWQRCLATGEPFELEYRFVFPAQSPRWYLGRAIAVRDESGAITRWYGTSTDIHDQKMAERALTESRERLRAALDASATGTFRWHIDTNELEWDANLDRLFGLSPETTPRSLSDFIRLVHPDDRQRVIDASERSAKDGADFEEEFRVVWPDGTTRWLYDQGRLYSDEGRRSMAGACVDVTERRQKEDALRTADRQKDEFLGMLAHELRNPLAPMAYSAAVLERLLPDPAARRPLDVINRQVRRMTRIVDDLLDVSRVTQGKVSLKRDEVDVAMLVAEVAEANRPTLDSRNHAFQVDIRDAPLLVSGDPVRVTQIVENLLNNAAKYTPAGGRVTLSARRESAHAVISVRDSGVGIAPAMLPRVFELFVQADTSLDRSEGGLGIGLTLVDQLVRLHGGRVEVRSEGIGSGSEFIVYLPLVGAVAASDSGLGDAGSKPALARRVLIVDDNVDSAESLKTLLEMQGHLVCVVHDGSSATAAAREFAAELVLLDIGLPGMDGFQVVRQIRSSPDLAHLVVVATTGYGREQDRLRCLDAGFNDHLTKPVDVDHVATILATVAAVNPSGDVIYP